MASKIITPDSNVDKRSEAEQYIEKHRVADIFQGLTQALILERPGTSRPSH